MLKRILIACEESQAVTKEFRKLGFEAFSCDLLPCSGGHPEWHLQNDVFKVIEGGIILNQKGQWLEFDKWDLIIAFPPCTHLAVSGAAHFEKKRLDGRQKEGINFFMQFVNANCDKIVIENPIGIISGDYIGKHFPELREKYNLPLKPSQIIQPWQFGDSFQKSTCLWIKGLPNLEPTNIVSKGEFKEWVCPKTGKTKRQPLWFFEALKTAKTKEERSTLRSKTFPGIAKAMAVQWSKYL
jgi:site-specific DNA-cytosine methylase